MLAFLKNNPTKKQITWIKGVVFIVCLIPLLRLIWLGVADNLSANPIEFVERSTGFWALFILLATLTLTPIRLLTGRAWQIQMRRMLGLFMFFYVCLHIITYVWLDFAFDWLDITKDIALTSTNSMMKRLRERWKQLHQLVYLIAILAIVHFWWLVKKDIREPLLYACILMVLFGIRIYYKYTKTVKVNSKVQINSL
ncbi:MAG: protein-methionine-sulfoxide reductase heme-binding subunit MsrQ [Pseudomonadota bacterium]